MSQERIVLQERDLKMLAEIEQSPACSRTHIAHVFFDGRYEPAKKRLQQLSRAGFIRNNDETALGRSILRITQEGLTQVHPEERQLWSDAKSVPQWLCKHEQMLADVRSAFISAAGTNGFEISFRTSPNEITFRVWCSEHELDEMVRPDGFALINDLHSRFQSQHFFIEVDRSTETQGHLAHLARQYKEHSRSGNFKPELTRYSNENRISFRILLIVKSRERLVRTAVNLRQSAGIGSLVWISVIDDFLADPFGLIWFCPKYFEDLSTHEGLPLRLF